jgi:hypothetical protein
MTARLKLTAERLREVVTYDPETGYFTWLPRAGTDRCTKAWTKRHAHRRAGYLHKPSGYWLITVDGKLYKAHRLAHLHMTGEWPAKTIDHVQRQRADNRWNELRPATLAENGANTGLARSNTSGCKGVCWDPVNQRWRAYGTAAGRQHSFGRYALFEDAVAARQVGAQRIHGAFVRHALSQAAVEHNRLIPARRDAGD